jgi:hypothetical protein
MRTLALAPADLTLIFGGVHLAIGGTLLAPEGVRKRNGAHRMHMSIIPAALAASWLVIGCAASFPPPTQDLAQAQSATRSAIELGAAKQPNAQLHVELARELMAQATLAMNEGHNERADGLILRAKSDAELAISLMRDSTAKTGAQSAAEQSNAQQIVNVNQGAVQ